MNEPRGGHRNVRLRLDLTGAIQGVGFRPTVYRIAASLGLSGWVRNSRAGVEIEIEGAEDQVGAFEPRLRRNLPLHASIATCRKRKIPDEASTEFKIRQSSANGDSEPAEIMPDLATCPACLEELFDPSDRRFGYPFINCTHCGPRFSIALGLPYDREATTMRTFTMCDACRREYRDPASRRFHAQPNACPDCGPQLTLVDAAGRHVANKAEALEGAARAIESGRLVALKGIGGFHLVADARSRDAIEELRTRKHRPSKPFALMMPSLGAVRREVIVSDDEADWLSSAAAPIVILRRLEESTLPGSLAPGNPQLGVMLPYSPVHHLLMKRLDFPVVATSGNRRDEPICIANEEAISRLESIADRFLVHDRPIARPVDDSVIKRIAGGETMLRRSRGFAPASLPVSGASATVVAAGGDLKSTIAVAGAGRVRIGQHLGDLETAESQTAFQFQLDDFPALCGIQPGAIAVDSHPSYYSSRLARRTRRPIHAVQHHHAHAVACAAENGLDRDTTFLAVAWDGTGYGEDGTIWGGEFLVCQADTFRRFAWLRPFRLPGGEKAIRDPRFAAMGCLYEAGIPPSASALTNFVSDEEVQIVRTMLERDLHTPRTSSAGRLVDAVSAICGLAERNEFEGQAAMALESVASTDASLAGYAVDEIEFEAERPVDWVPIVKAVVEDSSAIPVVSRRFHQAMADVIVNVCRVADCSIVALTGGCFQNALLAELALDRLETAGFQPIRHGRVPPNDGGLAFGQAVIASRTMSAHSP